MQVNVVSTTGKGFACPEDFPEGITMLELFERVAPNSKPENFLIRLNGQPVAPGIHLNPGDTAEVSDGQPLPMDTVVPPDSQVSMTPKGIKGN